MLHYLCAKHNFMILGRFKIHLVRFRSLSHFTLKAKQSSLINPRKTQSKNSKAAPPTSNQERNGAWGKRRRLFNLKKRALSDNKLLFPWLSSHALVPLILWINHKGRTPSARSSACPVKHREVFMGDKSQRGCLPNNAFITPCPPRASTFTTHTNDSRMDN